MDLMSLFVCGYLWEYIPDVYGCLCTASYHMSYLMHLLSQVLSIMAFWLFYFLSDLNILKGDDTKKKYGTETFTVAQS